MRKFSRILTLLALPAALAACGGGGGGASSATLGGFTRFSAIGAGVPTRIDGDSQQVSYTFDGTVTTLGTPTAFAPTASATFTVDAVGDPTALSFTSSAGTALSFNTAAGDTIGEVSGNPGVGMAVSADGDKGAFFSRSNALGWDYQTFGLWMTGQNSGSGTVGAFSLGARTPGAAIPTSGTATYTGSSGGFYVDASGASFLVTSNMSAATDFAARSITFNTSGTGTLDLSGTLTYAAATNRFTGTIASVGGGLGNAPMTGTATGYFYGPAAEEIGGGFAVSGGGGTGYLGAFGGKR